MACARRKGNRTVSSQLQFLSLFASLGAHPMACDAHPMATTLVIAFCALICMLLRAR